MGRIARIRARSVPRLISGDDDGHVVERSALECQRYQGVAGLLREFVADAAEDLVRLHVVGQPVAADDEQIARAEWTACHIEFGRIIDADGPRNAVAAGPVRGLL